VLLLDLSVALIVYLLKNFISEKVLALLIPFMSSCDMFFGVRVLLELSGQSDLFNNLLIPERVSFFNLFTLLAFSNHDVIEDQQSSKHILISLLNHAVNELEQFDLIKD